MPWIRKVQYVHAEMLIIIYMPIQCYFYVYRISTMQRIQYTIAIPITTHTNDLPLPMSSVDPQIAKHR